MGFADLFVVRSLKKPSLNFRAGIASNLSGWQNSRRQGYVRESERRVIRQGPDYQEGVNVISEYYPDNCHWPPASTQSRRSA